MQKQSLAIIYVIDCIIVSKSLANNTLSSNVVVLLFVNVFIVLVSHLVIVYELPLLYLIYYF
jgi:hypothetical protein